LYEDAGGRVALGRQRDDRVALTCQCTAPRRDQTAIWRARKGLNGLLNLASVPHVDRAYLDLEHRRYSLNDTELGGLGGVGGFPKDRYSRHVWRNLFKQLQPFHAYTVFEKHEPGDVATRAGQVVDVARADR